MDAPAPEAFAATHQTVFHSRWKHLRDRHVRDLAWLIDAPDLLNPSAPQWEGKIASLPTDAAQRASQWLSTLDASPGELHAFIDIGRYTRLGRYAEKLIAYYFREHGMLAAHGLQVRTGRGDTIGEFDFLLHDGDTLAHWELATKFYLLATDGNDAVADYFVGPNLADTLQAKMRKILRRQLALGMHPAAQSVLPGQIGTARAFIKGWLFAPRDYNESFALAGVSDTHCRGCWIAYANWQATGECRYLVLPRLRWLAPVQALLDETLDAHGIAEALAASFNGESTPVMLAKLTCEPDGWWRECERAFVVPDDWRLRALKRREAGFDVD